MVTIEKFKQTQPTDESEQVQSTGSGLLVLQGSTEWLQPGAEFSTSAVRPVFPSRFLLAALRDARLRVRTPLAVSLSTENDDFVMEAIEVSEFGFGKNPSETVIDLQHAVAELYFALEKEQGRLGPDLQKVWETLQEKIIKR